MSKVSYEAARKHCKCLCEWRGELERLVFGERAWRMVDCTLGAVGEFVVRNVLGLNCVDILEGSVYNCS